MLSFLDCDNVIDDESERGYYASISTRGAQNTSSHSSALLRFQSYLGLDYTLFNFLYCYYGKCNIYSSID